MARKSLLYYIFGVSNLPLYVDNGLVKEANAAWNRVDGNPAHLQNDPIGWKDALVKYARNTKYWGIFRDYTVPLRFPKDGAKILHWLFWNGKSYETEAKFGILKLDRLSLPYTYKSWNLTEFNFVKYKEGKTDITIEALEGGVSKYLKAFENVEYSIPLDEFQVKFDGMFLDGKIIYNGFQSWDGPVGQHLVPFVISGEEGTRFALVLNAGGMAIGGAIFPDYEAVSDSWMFSAIKDTEITIEGVLRFINAVGAVPPNLGDYTVRLRTSTDRSIVIGAATIDVENQMWEVTISGTWLIEANENVFLEAEWGGTFNLLYLEDTVWNVTFRNRFDTTYNWCISPALLWERLVAKMTNGLFEAKSAWLPTRNDLAFTSGMSLRNLADPVIKISVASFFKTMARFSAGMGIEDNKLALEDLAYFFKTNLVAELGEVDNAFMYPAEDLLVNTISAGMEDVDYEDVNGRNEFNQLSKWTLPVTKVTKDLDLTTPVHTDPYGIEFERTDFKNKDSTDSNNDNEPYLINIETDLQPADVDVPEHYRLNRPVFTIITGVPDIENIFNVLLSPARAVYDNSALIHSLLDKMDGEKILFQNNVKNDNLRTILDGVEIDENADIYVNTLADRLFLPYYFEFKTQTPHSLLNIMNVTPYGKVSFIWNGITWFGFFLDGSVKPAMNDVQQWKLLATPENDVSKFNKY